MSTSPRPPLAFPLYTLVRRDRDSGGGAPVSLRAGAERWVVVFTSAAAAAAYSRAAPGGAEAVAFADPRTLLVFLAQAARPPAAAGVVIDPAGRDPVHVPVGECYALFLAGV